MDQVLRRRGIAADDAMVGKLQILSRRVLFSAQPLLDGIILDAQPPLLGWVVRDGQALQGPSLLGEMLHQQFFHGFREILVAGAGRAISPLCQDRCRLPQGEFLAYSGGDQEENDDNLP